MYLIEHDWKDSSLWVWAELPERRFTLPSMYRRRPQRRISAGCIYADSHWVQGVFFTLLVATRVVEWLVLYLRLFAISSPMYLRNTINYKIHSAEIKTILIPNALFTRQIEIESFSNIDWCSAELMRLLVNVNALRTQVTCFFFCS